MKLLRFITCVLFCVHCFIIFQLYEVQFVAVDKRQAEYTCVGRPTEMCMRSCRHDIYCLMVYSQSLFYGIVCKSVKVNTCDVNYSETGGRF